MDAKALAKSKRAHSQHHSKKSHLAHKPKLPSDVAKEAGIAKNPLGKQVVERINQFPSASALPSNWDRYEEEQNAVFDGISGENSKQISEVVLPKSKGGDYNHLIAEAKLQRDLHSSFDSFPSLSDVLPADFSHGVGSMLSVRGENMLSWIGDDSFVVEDKTSASSEAPFLSLNLNALAEQLAKIDLAERLFIEKDILPPELCSDGNEINDQHGMEKSDHEETLQKAVQSIPEEFSDVISFADQNANANVSWNQVDANSIEREMKKLPKFEAATAEADLDMLLGSFDERNDLTSNANSTEPPRKDLHSSRAATKMADFDDPLDHLLEETRNLKTTHEGKEVHNDSHSSSLLSETKPKVVDDFDSWFDSIS